MTKDKLLTKTLTRGDCSVWTGAKTPDGYGNVNIKGKHLTYGTMTRLAKELNVSYSTINFIRRGLSWKAKLS